MSDQPPDSPPTGNEARVIHAELGEMTEVESMCPKCEENGTTRLMITKIPHFREVIVSSFECANPDCRESNQAVQFGGEMFPKRVKFELSVRCERDMNRQVVKSDYATLTIPELELELPRETQKGSLNTVEGVLRQVQQGLELQQPLRRAVDPPLAEKVDAFVAKLDHYCTGTVPFTLLLDDPAGNSYIEGYYPDPSKLVDPQLTRFEITRTRQERELLCIAADEYNAASRTDGEEQIVDAAQEPEEQVNILHEPCPACMKDGELKVHQLNVPNFGPTVIMAFRCDTCGYKTNDVKSGGNIRPKGKRITLRVTDKSDLARDVLKSDSATVQIPEIELELGAGSLGSFFSSVEGLLTQIYDNLFHMRQVDFAEGDSGAVNPQQQQGAGGRGGAMRRFLNQLQLLKEAEPQRPFTLVLDDPLGFVYVQNPRSHLPPPHNLDPRLDIEEYTRTAEQEEEFAILSASDEHNAQD